MLLNLRKEEKGKVNGKGGAGRSFEKRKISIVSSYIQGHCMHPLHDGSSNASRICHTVFKDVSLAETVGSGRVVSAGGE